MYASEGLHPIFYLVSSYNSNMIVPQLQSIKFHSTVEHSSKSWTCFYLSNWRPWAMVLEDLFLFIHFGAVDHFVELPAFHQFFFQFFF